MGNIVGEGFDSRITGQVNRRQKTHGSGYNGETLRTNEELVVLNNNTAWVKLMSSVSIDELTGDEGINNPTIAAFKAKGDQVAKSFVLFNGTSEFISETKDETGNVTKSFTTQRGGIDFTNTLRGQNNVYGIGGSVDFGLNPMMGITGIDVKHKNRGSIRTATVTVKAFNKAQFEIIDVLYMRLGFSVLLEWGNSMYFKNDDTYVPDGGQENSLTSDWFKDSDYQSFLGKIRNKSLSSDGNYDAMLAKVSNYHWSFQKDGSYDITINLVSAGDVVESFKMDAAAAHDSIKIVPNSTSYPLKIYLAKDKHKLGAFLWDRLINYENQNFNNLPVNSLYEETDDSNNKIRHIDVISRTDTEDNSDGSKSQYYIRMGDLLYWLQEEQMYKVDGKPFLNFDYDYKDNLMDIYRIDNVPYMPTSLLPFDLWPNGHILHQISYDPFVCIASQKFETTPAYSNTFHGGFDNILDGKYTTPFISSQDLFEKKIGTKYYGRIMNIYLNYEFLLDQISKNVDEDGDVLLIDFLKSVLNGVNEAFGGINTLQPIIDPTTNTVKIIDVNPLHSSDNLLNNFGLETNTANFNLYGYSEAGGESNFIHDFNLTTEITPALSTMITVAATSNKTVVGEDNTALSKINKGLTDRYKKKLIEPESKIISPLMAPSTSYTYNMLQYLKLAFGVNGTDNTIKLTGDQIDYDNPGGLFQHMISISFNYFHKDQCDIYKKTAKKIFQLYHNIKNGMALFLLTYP
jgi:hypothetical protein